jgi:hypothetical protein
MPRTQFILEPEDRHHVGVFVHAALDHLWYGSPDAAPDGLGSLLLNENVDVDGARINGVDMDDYRGCCTKCCGPCHSLFTLLKTSQLDIWVRFWPEDLLGTSWWNAEKGVVDRAWLDRAWANEDRLGCHE